MTDSIFPNDLTEETIEETQEDLPMAKEWAWDFEKNEFKTRNGKMYLVEGNEAIKIWIWKLFQTPRYRCLIYSWNYGHEFEDLIGRTYTQEFLNAEAKRCVEEAVEYNLKEYVTDIRNINIDFDDNILKIDFTVVTPYGEVEMNV